MRIRGFEKFGRKFSLRLAILRKFLSIMQVKPVHIIVPLFLSFLSSVFDGISLVLLVPLAKGMVSNFDFIKTTPVLKNIIALFPEFFANPPSPNQTAFLFIAGLIFIAIVLKNVIIYLNSVLSVHWHVNFQSNVYKFIFNRFMIFGKLFFDRTSQGYLNMVLNYTETVLRTLTVCELSANRIFTLTIYTATMFMISWKLTLISVCIFPLLHYSLKFIIKKIYQIAQLRNKAWAELNRKVFNFLSCIPLVKAYSKESEAIASYAKITEQLKIIDSKAARTFRLIEPVQDLIINVFLLGMVAIVALLLARDKPAEISSFVVFFYAAKRSLPLFNVFNDLRANFAQAKPPLKELLNIVDDKNKFFIIEGKNNFEGLKKGIEFKHLNYSYTKGVAVLRDISFFIPKGKMTAIVGPSGAGKTTIISLIVRFYDCPPQSILFDGFDVRDFTLKSTRMHMALVSQEALLFNDTLRNNIVFGLDRCVTDEELCEVTRKTRIYDFIMRLPDGFNTEIGDRGIKLSGGERQRIALTRALLKGSEILILDEATSSLDTNTEKLIQEAIDEAVKGRTTIVIAHRFSTIKNADKIIVIDKGMLVESGSLDQLLAKKGIFYGYWEAQKFY
ncbi:MAG: ABC transporter ATP-binding protein [Candidatus Omnitrophica bacterium]|nr:ABC transporter ATP-binding protein [Candidatus Omnitrophota bacterium]